MTETSLYSTIIETTRALIVVLDVDGRIVMFNPACERLTGYRFDEVRGRPFWDFLLTPEEREPVKAVFRDLRAGHFPNAYENYWVAKSGERRFIEWSNSAVTDNNGRVTHVIGTGIDVTGRRDADVRLREIQRRHRALLDSVGDWVWMMDAEGRYVEHNRIHAQRWGVEQDHLLGKTAFQVLPYSIAEEIAAENREILSTGKPLRKVIHRVSDGQERWLDVIKTPVIDANGNMTGIAGVGRDITDNKLAERTAHEAQQRQKALLDGIPDSAWLVDANFRYIEVNRRFAERWGCNPSDVVGKTALDILPPAIAGKMDAENREVLRTGRPLHIEQCYEIQGKAHWLEVTKVPVTDSAGAVIGIAGLSRDITERKRAEQALQLAQQHQSALLNTISDSVWLKDAKGTYLAVNSEWLKRHDMETHQVLGKTSFDIFSAAHAANIADEDRRVLESKQQLRFEGTRIFQGEERWIETIKTPVFDGEGNVVGITSVGRDNTERKIREAQRIARDAAQRDALVKEVHHRIKNNLQGTITLIQEMEIGNPESAELLETAVTRLNALATLHGLYGTSGERDLRLEQVMQRLVASLQGLHGRLPMRLTVRSPVSARVSDSEAVPLALILNELIMNAIKHSRAADNDFVQIALESAGNGARIVIRNRSGKLPKYFNFDGGTGLGTGLALVRSLLPPSGMALRFENAPGRPGTEVELTLCPPVITLLSPAASPSIATREPVHGAHPDRRG